MPGTAWSSKRRSTATAESGDSDDRAGLHPRRRQVGAIAAGADRADALFLLMFVTVPLRRLRNLDLLVLASVTLTIWVLNQRLFELSIWLAIPIWLYLALRCFGSDFRISRNPPKRDAPVVDAVMDKARAGIRRLRCKWAVGLAGSAPSLLCIPGGSTGDVGVASLSGATQLLHGTLPYGHIATDIVHGDTYPIFAYLLYIPAALIFCRFTTSSTTPTARFGSRRSRCWSRRTRCSSPARNCRRQRVRIAQRLRVAGVSAGADHRELRLERHDDGDVRRARRRVDRVCGTIDIGVVICGVGEGRASVRRCRCGSRDFDATAGRRADRAGRDHRSRCSPCCLILRRHRTLCARCSTASRSRPAAARCCRRGR